MKIEYLLLFESSGIPIYSHCFGNFCLHAGVEDTLLAGFLTALSTMPEILGKENDELKSIEMGSTKLLFSKTESKKMIVLGIDPSTIDNKTDEVVNQLFHRIEKLLEDKYKDVNWGRALTDVRYKFEHELVDGILKSTLEVFTDYCKAGDDCLFGIHTSIDTPEISTTKTIWDRIEARYNYAIDQIPFFKKLFIGYVSKINSWKDRRDYNRKLSLQSVI